MTELERVFAGGGEMGARMRAKDWSQTPLGPTEGWPTTLRTTVALMLVAPLPMVILWGPELRLLYNDAHIPLFGDKHPRTLGATFFDLFPELRDGLSPLFAQVWAGTAVSQKEGLLCLERQGFMEEVYFSLSFLPIRDEHDRVVGILNIASEVTAQVLGERHLKTLRELSIQSALSPGVQDVLHQAQGVLAQSGADVPFALLYRMEGESARRALCSGLEADGSRSPQTLALSDPHSPWPLAEVLDSGETRLVEGLGARGGALHAGPWPEPVSRALLLPLALGTSGARDAVLIVGLSPRLPLDEGYRAFLQVLARQLAADVVRAQALEQETQRAARLAEMDRVKTAFFSNVSHEFRTPLTLMLGPTENALASPEQALRGEDLKRVHRNELRLLKLVNTLLDLSRLEAGRTQGRFVPTDLAALTAGLASAFDSTVTRAGLRLTVDCPALPEPVWVDPDMWEKIVLNLVSNAFKFTLQGDITVLLRWRDTHAELSVQDTGTGIPVEQQGLIFERFHRVEGAWGRSEEGTGIGLSLVRELVELHGGRVRVESAPGQGSTFTVELPAGRAHLPAERVLQEPPRVSTATGSRAFVQEAEQWIQATPEAVEEQELPAPSGEGPRGHVLLVDDNADMRDYIARLLRGHFRVEAVADGQAALEAARAHPPDMVLSDVMMPRLDGFGLVRELKADARTAHVPVMLLSARASEKATLEGFAAGGMDYMVKPFRARELLARVGALVKTTQARAEVKAAQARIEGLIQNSPAFVCALNGPQHVFQVANARYQQLVGEGRPLLGLTVQEALPEVVEQGFIGLLDKVFATGEPFHGRQLPIQLRRREEGPLEDTVLNFVYQPRWDAQGQVEGIDVFGFEVTELVRARQQAELLAQQLGESEARQRRLLEYAGAGLWELDAATGHIAADARMVELMGLPPGTAFSLESGLLQVPIEDRELVAQAIAAALAGKNGGAYLMTFRTGGEGGVPLRWVESRAQATFDKHGRPLFLSGVMLDITVRKKAEMLLARQARHHALNAQVGLALSRSVSLHEMLQRCVQALVDQLTMASARVWLHDPGQDVLELSASAGMSTHLEGPQGRVPVGRGMIGLIAQERRPHLTNSVVDDPRLGDPGWARREGMKAFAGYPLLVGDKLVGVVALFARPPMEPDTLDVLRLVADSIALGVERLRAESAIQTRLDFEQKLIGIVSHDLRNPLSAILMGTSLLMRRETLDARTTQSLVRIQSAAERATRMIKDLLDFTQARLGGGLRIERRPMDMHQLIQGVMDEVEVAWPEREIRLQRQGDGQGEWDADRMAQVVQNLVTNAIKYSPAESPVYVTLHGEEAEVILSVANQGPPIPADKLTSIFEPMQRATAEVDKAGRSVGLGLYIVKRILDAHEGRIEVVSTPQEGTRFTVWLPRQAAPRGLDSPRRAVTSPRVESN
ncbi:ATP-binding protein [Cystobacter fuscus]|uniref:ATP-binding protein n=1 Tax=Cystobacter fuscus TaxID=43 RepID=UPI0037C07C31